MKSILAIGSFWYTICLYKSTCFNKFQKSNQSLTTRIKTSPSGGKNPLSSFQNIIGKEMTRPLGLCDNTVWCCETTFFILLFHVISIFCFFCCSIAQQKTGAALVVITKENIYEVSLCVALYSESNSLSGEIPVILTFLVINHALL